MVSVIKLDGTYTDPCSNSVARLLLKDKKAVVAKYNPFTIRLTVNLDDAYNNLINPVEPNTTDGGDS